MHHFEGMIPAGAAAQQAGIQSAAQAAHNGAVAASNMERLVAAEIDAWAEDRNPAHLLRAIDVLQHMVRISSAVAAATAGAVGHAAGSHQSPPHSGQLFHASGVAASGPVAHLAADAPPGLLRDAASFAKNRVHHAVDNFRRTIERAERTLKDAVNAGRSEGLSARPPGYTGRASGQIAQGSQPPGYAGRVSGTIP